MLEAWAWQGVHQRHVLPIGSMRLCTRTWSNGEECIKSPSKICPFFIVFWAWAQGAQLEWDDNKCPGDPASTWVFNFQRFMQMNAFLLPQSLSRDQPPERLFFLIRLSDSLCIRIKWLTVPCLLMRCANMPSLVVPALVGLAKRKHWSRI